MGYEEFGAGALSLWILFTGIPFQVGVELSTANKQLAAFGFLDSSFSFLHSGLSWRLFRGRLVPLRRRAYAQATDRKSVV